MLNPLSCKSSKLTEISLLQLLLLLKVKKPNGDSYAADSVLYLTYGIQEYLFENGRIDNIFTDQYYEPFTSALHEVVKDFKVSTVVPDFIMIIFITFVTFIEYYQDYDSLEILENRYYLHFY